MNKKETKKKQFKLHCPKLAWNKISKQTQWVIQKWEKNMWDPSKIEQTYIRSVCQLDIDRPKIFFLSRWQSLFFDGPAWWFVAHQSWTLRHQGANSAKPPVILCNLIILVWNFILA